MSVVSFAAWLVLPGVITFATTVSTLSTDTAVIILEILICFLLIDLFDQEQAQDFQENYFALLILAAIGVMVKLSIILFSASAIVIATCLLIWRQSRVLKAKPFWVVSTLVSLVLVAWLVHGVILSGYPLFPSPMFPFPVEWRVPMKTTVELNHLIRVWPRLVEGKMKAQSYEEALSNWDWLNPWLSALSRDVWGFKIPLALLVVGICLTGCLFLRDKERANLKIGLKSAFPVIAMNIVLLFVMLFYVPDIRFVWGIIWVLAALLLAVPLVALEAKRGLIAFQAIAILSLMLTAKSFHGSLKLAWARMSLPETSSSVVEFKTKTGLLLNVPKNEGKCSKAAVPCTPYPSALLSRREEGGFKVEPFSEEAIVGWHTIESLQEQMKP